MTVTALQDGVAAAVEQAQTRHRRRRVLALAALALCLGLSFLAASGIGAVAIRPGEIIAILLSWLGIAGTVDFTAQQEVVLAAVRLPRTVLAALAGAGLAASGAALQGLFRNPLADPGLIGVSSGAALAAVATIVLGAPLAGMLGITPFLLMPLAAFGGGLAATYIVYRIGMRNGLADTPTMLLAGVAINAIALAFIGFFTFVSDDQQLRELSLWMLGSLGGVTWSTLLPTLPFLVLPLVALPRLARALNALLLGQKDAQYLGFDPAAITRAAVVLAALSVGASVALTGIIAFVGLLVPHLVRLLLGPDHRVLLPAAMLLGASLMLIADLVARLVVLPAELPIGVVTSIVGGPFFLWLLIRRRASGGW